MQINEMAYSRERFRERIQEKVAGAYLESLTADVFEFNGESKWIIHKRTETDRLLAELDALQFIERKGKWVGKDAAQQAADAIFNRRGNLLTTASNAMRRYFKRESLPIPAAKTSRWFHLFEGRVNEIIAGFLY